MNEFVINVAQDPSTTINVGVDETTLIQAGIGLPLHSVSHISGGNDELNHNLLTDLQGGAANQYYHLSSGQYFNLTTGSVVRPSETGVFYTANNPSGFITGVDLSAYVTGSVVRPSDTGNFITISQTGVFYPTSNPSGFVTGSVVRPSDTGNFITTSQTGAFYASSNPSGFITGISNLVFATGNQSIDGVKNFSSAPTINGNAVATVVDPVRTTLTGNGALSSFAISGAANLSNPSALIVAIDGALQEPTVDYSVSAGVITFIPALANGAKAVVISPTNVLQTAQMIPSDGSVTSAKIATGVTLTNPIINGTLTVGGQTQLTGQAATDANSAMTRSLCEASFSNPITQGGTIVPVPAIALQRSTLVNGGTSVIATLTAQTPRVTCTTTLDSSAVLRSPCNDGITTRVNSSNQKTFADKFGWVLIGLLGARGVGSRGKVIIGGNSTPAEMIVEGTLGSDGIVLESQSLVANTPRFRLVVRNGATTTVGSFVSGAGVYNAGLVGQWWIVMESGTTSAYYRLEQGAWILICSVEAVPATSTVVGGNGVAIVAYTPDSSAAGGSSLQLNQIYETFGITPD